MPITRTPIALDDLTALRIPSDPQTSPDGTRILFTLREADPEKPGRSRTTLWSVGVDGGDLRQLTAGPKDSQGRWSADGRTIAFVRSEPRGQGQIWPQLCLLPSDGGEARPLTKFAEGAIGWFSWSPDGTRIAVSYRRTDPRFTVSAAKARKERGESDPPRVLDELWYRLDGDGYFNAARFALHVVDAVTGKARVVFDGDTVGAFSADWSPASDALVITANVEREPLLAGWADRLFLCELPRSGGPRVRELRGAPDGPKTSVLWSPDGRRLAWAGREDRVDGLYSTENLGLWIADIVRTGTPALGKVRCVTDGTDFCLMAATLSDCADAAFAPIVRWGRGSDCVYTRIGVCGRGHVVSFPVDGSPATGRGTGRGAGRGSARKGAPTGPVTHTHAAGDHIPGSFSLDGSVMSMTLTTPASPPEIHVARVRNGRWRVDCLTTFNQRLLAARVVVEPVSHHVPATDGYRSQLWELRPPNIGGRRRTPGILLVHGGPHAQYGEVFFHEMQLLVAQGYTVFFGNPRGSKGYGRDHCAAIRGCWGTKDWDDVQGYLSFMEQHPGIDPKRLAIAGGSYGGYMTCWAIGHTTMLRCAITDRCVSNLLSMAGNSDYPDRPDEYWPGAVWERWEQRWESSPIKHMGAARTPTLVIHSEGDLRCNIEQSEEVFTALKTLGVPTRFVRYPASTSHGMSRTGPPDLRRHRLTEMLTWFQRWLKGVSSRHA